MPAPKQQQLYPAYSRACQQQPQHGRTRGRFPAQPCSTSQARIGPRASSLPRKPRHTQSSGRTIAIAGPICEPNPAGWQKKKKAGLRLQERIGNSAGWRRVLGGGSLTPGKGDHQDHPRFTPRAVRTCPASLWVRVHSHLVLSAEPAVVIFRQLQHAKCRLQHRSGTLAGMAAADGADTASDICVGDRVRDKSGNRATVRYVGPVATSKSADAVYVGEPLSSALAASLGGCSAKSTCGHAPATARPWL